MAFYPYDQCFIFYLDGDVVDDVVGSIDLDRGFSFGLGVDDVYCRTGLYGIELFDGNVLCLVGFTGFYCRVGTLVVVARRGYNGDARCVGK